VHVLEIPDEYRFMDPELIELLEDGVRSVLKEIAAPSAPTTRRSTSAKW